MPYTIGTHPSKGTTYDTTDELLVDILNAATSNGFTVISKETIITLDGVGGSYAINDAVIGVAGNSYVEMGTQNGYSGRQTSVRIYYSATGATARFRLYLYNDAPVAQVDNAAAVLTTATAKSIGEITFDPMEDRGGRSFAQNTIDWMDYVLPDTNNRFYFILVPLDAFAFAADETVTVSFTHLIKTV